MTDNQAAFNKYLAILSASLLASQEGRLADPEVCEHRFRVAVNPNKNVCLVCRRVADEPSKYGIFLTDNHTQVDPREQGRDAYWKWFESKGRRTCIDGTEPNNPYPANTSEHDEWDKGRRESKEAAVLTEMGR